MCLCVFSCDVGNVLTTVVDVFSFGLGRFERSKQSQNKSNGRRFGTGRIVVEHGSADQNPFLSSSELAVAGRPVHSDELGQGAPTVRLPKGQELLLPEQASADADIKIAERVRPSPEQSAAQKGIQRAEALLTSLLRGMPFHPSSAALLINWTGYVEEFGTAAPRSGYFCLPLVVVKCFFFKFV